jgi:hypothetical protein
MILRCLPAEFAQTMSRTVQTIRPGSQAADRMTSLKNGCELQEDRISTVETKRI